MHNLRGVDKRLLSAFKDSPLFKLIKENKRDFLACIRNNAIGIYYNADRVAMASLNRNGSLECDINSYYLTGKENGKTITITPEEICESIKVIKANSDSKKSSTNEKKAQQALVYSNNCNPESQWICIDIEYRQSTKIQSGLAEMFTGRFDIIAVSKTQPHRIAVVELKYNDNSIGGDSGIVKHLKDFHLFNNPQCIDNLKKEVRDILDNLSELAPVTPLPIIKNTSEDICDKIEFYVVCLYDTPKSPRGKVGGYLFKTKHPYWGTKRISKYNAETILPFANEILPKVNFLFRKVTDPANLNISDILDINNYEK